MTGREALVAEAVRGEVDMLLLLASRASARAARGEFRIDARMMTQARTRVNSGHSEIIASPSAGSAHTETVGCRL
jgi:hypothetical protein